MALDWNKPIHLSDVTRKTSGGSGYPSKTTMNLAETVTTNETDLRKVIPLAAVLLVAVLLFVKFGVVDMFGQVTERQAALATEQGRVSAIESKLTDYDSVKAEYQGYSSSSSKGEADAVSVLDMVEQQVMPSASVTGITLKDNVLTLTIQNVTLDTVGKLADVLRGQSLVSNVSVATAKTSASSGSNVIATVTVTLVSTSTGSATTSSATASK
ncbi:MAG: hypothetical protein WAY93_00500 [Atopobiaceae bacterium]